MGFLERPGDAHALMRNPQAGRVATALAVTLLQTCSCMARAEVAASGNAIAGVTFAGEAARIALLEARVDSTRHLSLAAAVAHLEAAGGYNEVQLRLVATAAFAIDDWSIDNRHLISLSTESVERYRMRVRAARSGLFGQRSLSARAFDELFFDFDRGRWVRNNVALGLGVQISRTLSGELYHVWENNRSADDESYVLALITLRFGGQH